MQSSLSRRALLAGGTLLAGRALAADQPRAHKLKVAIFSKHLQFLQGDELATAAAALGFDGVDITVRKGGHVAARARPPGSSAAGGRHPAATAWKCP